MKKIFIGLVVALLAMLTPTAAFADESRFTVDQSGITLPDGQVFPDNGHVNIQSDPWGFDLHFESKCINRTDNECQGKLHDSAQFIGKGFIPWESVGVYDGACVKWVQVSGYDYHFGENGEAPVCVGDEFDAAVPLAVETSVKHKPEETTVKHPTELEKTGSTPIALPLTAGLVLVALAVGTLIYARWRANNER